MKPVYTASFLVLALVATPRWSAADPTDAKATAAAEASARDHFQRGQKLSANGEYAGAYREFAAGYALTERPLFLFNMAEAARANGELAKARDNYVQFMRADPKSALAATAQARVAELDRAAAPPKPEPAPAAVTVAPAASGEPVKPIPSPAATASSIPPPASTLPALSPRPVTDEPTPVWKRWPFWAVVGGVVAGSVVVFAVSRDSDACGGGCSEINFR